MNRRHFFRALIGGAAAVAVVPVVAQAAVPTPASTSFTTGYVHAMHVITADQIVNTWTITNTMDEPAVCELTVLHRTKIPCGARVKAQLGDDLEFIGRLMRIDVSPHSNHVVLIADPQWPYPMGVA